MEGFICVNFGPWFFRLFPLSVATELFSMQFRTTASCNLNEARCSSARFSVRALHLPTSFHRRVQFVLLIPFTAFPLHRLRRTIYYFSFCVSFFFPSLFAWVFRFYMRRFPGSSLPPSIRREKSAERRGQTHSCLSSSSSSSSCQVGLVSKSGHGNGNESRVSSLCPSQKQCVSVEGNTPRCEVRGSFVVNAWKVLCFGKVLWVSAENGCACESGEWWVILSEKCLVSLPLIASAALHLFYSNIAMLFFPGIPKFANPSFRATDYKYRSDPLSRQI